MFKYLICKLKGHVLKLERDHEGAWYPKCRRCGGKLNL